jgi:type III pantothenate kinase
MKLLLDIGNTRIKWAVLTEQGLGAQHAIVHEGFDATQLRSRVLEPCGAIRQVFVANVAGEALATIVRQAVNEQWALSPVFATTRSHCGAIRNAYPDPGKLGVDRWLAVIGAYALASSAACVVDIGTAMTIDSLDDSGLHLGGLIVPGPSLMMDSLLRRTSDIASFSKWRSSHVPHAGTFFANNTWDCVYQGALQATAALIDAAHARLAEQITLTVPRLLLTGGASDSIAPLLHAPVQLAPDLVLRGLAVVAESM